MMVVLCVFCDLMFLFTLSFLQDDLSCWLLWPHFLFMGWRYCDYGGVSCTMLFDAS